jgi:hypothetical protein
VVMANGRARRGRACSERQRVGACEKAVRVGKVRSDSDRGGQPMGEHRGVSMVPGSGGIHGVVCQRPARQRRAGLGKTETVADWWA